MVAAHSKTAFLFGKRLNLHPNAEVKEHYVV